MLINIDMLRIHSPYKKNKMALLSEFFFNSVIMYLLSEEQKLSHEMEFRDTHVCTCFGVACLSLTYLGIQLWLFILLIIVNRTTKEFNIHLPHFVQVLYLSILNWNNEY